MLRAVAHILTRCAIIGLEMNRASDVVASWLWPRSRNTELTRCDPMGVWMQVLVG